MQVARPVGRDAATKKYDLLSALAAFGLSQDKHRQRQVMRFMALITTRYNWQRDELSMGQAEIAKLWSVDTRTVKREMAKLRALGWLVEKRCAARGRVALHGINFGRVMEDTRTAWPLIGPDFVARMIPEKPAPATNVVPFTSGPAPTFDDDAWGKISAAFHRRDPAGHTAWIASLVPASVEEGTMTLVAPSRFHARYVASNFADQLLRYAQSDDPALRQVLIIAA